MRTIRRRTFSRKFLLVPFISFVIVLAGGFAGWATVSALGTRYFADNASGDKCDVWNKAVNATLCGKVSIRLIDGETRFVRQTGTKLTAYFTQPTGTIEIHNINFCPASAGSLDTLQANDYFANNYSQLIGKSVTFFSIHGQILHGTAYGLGDGRCNSTATINLTGLKYNKDVQLYYADINVQPVNNHPGPCDTGPDVSGCDGVQNSYYVEEVGANQYEIAQQGADQDVNDQGHQVTMQQVSPGPNNNQYITYMARFGSDCSVTQTTQAKLLYYDLDNNPADPAGAQQGSKIQMRLYDVTAKQYVEIYDRNGNKSDPFTPSGIVNSVDWATFYAEPGHAYRWEIQNVYINNTVQISTPYPGIYYDRPCQPNHAPTGSISVDCVQGKQVVTFSFNDPDYATYAFIRTKSTNVYRVDKGKNDAADKQYQFVIPSKYIDPYNSQQVALDVEDKDSSGKDIQLDMAVGPGTNPVTTTPCADQLQCGSATPTPAGLIDYNTRFTITVDLTANFSTAPPNNATMDISVTGAQGQNDPYPDRKSNATWQSTGGGMGQFKATTRTIGPTNDTGVYDVDWQLTAGDLTKQCHGTITIWALPYLSVYGGDTEAGKSPSAPVTVGPDTVTNCGATNDDAGLYGWNNYSSDFSGAGTQYAAMALGQISGFASDQHASGRPDMPLASGALDTPIGLSFANVDLVGSAKAQPPSPSSGLFGGGLGTMTGTCDFTSDIKAGTPDTVIHTGSGKLSDLVAGLSDISSGRHIIVYVKGDVYIDTEVSYNLNGWNTVADIPSFRLVVVGNIYIDNGVTNLDGLYVAEPDGANTGTIYTCARSLGTPYKLEDSDFYESCRNTLTINGAFVAKQVQFLRTAGTVGQASLNNEGAHAAEVFHYSPEMWLPRDTSETVDDKYTAITGLPPVL